MQMAVVSKLISNVATKLRRIGRLLEHAAVVLEAEGCRRRRGRTARTATRSGRSMVTVTSSSAGAVSPSSVQPFAPRVAAQPAALGAASVAACALLVRGTGLVAPSAAKHDRVRRRRDPGGSASRRPAPSTPRAHGDAAHADRGLPSASRTCSSSVSPWIDDVGHRAVEDVRRRPARSAVEDAQALGPQHQQAAPAATAGMSRTSSGPPREAAHAGRDLDVEECRLADELGDEAVGRAARRCGAACRAA